MIDARQDTRCTPDGLQVDESHWSVLGLLRFVLAFSVMSCHTSNAAGYRGWLWTFGAFPAVCGFFIISGYSIGASIVQRPDGYFRRRARRIYPMAIAACLLTLCLLACFGNGVTAAGMNVAWPSAPAILATLLLLNGVAVVTPFIFQPLWSLDCEIVYYAVAPWLRRAPTAVVVLLAAASAAIFAIPISHGHSGAYPLATHGKAVVSLLWLWLLGFLAQRHPNNAWLVGATLLAGAVLVAGYAVAEGPLALPLFLATALAVCCLPKLTMPARWIGPANYLGELSYPLYLVHFPVTLFAGRLLAGMPVAGTIALCWTISLLMAAAFYHGIDRPIRTPRTARQPGCLPG